MKHPNKKSELIRKEYAWALIVRKRNKIKSCFDLWLLDNYLEPIPLNVQSLTQTLSKL
jgi:hypothetical protein